jgi:hypothetical protein
MNSLKIITFLILLTGNCWAAIRYVAPSGTDTGAGTINAPWKHIAFATCGGKYGCPCITSNSHLLSAGDTLFIRSGNYFESQINISNSGTAQAPIVLKAFHESQPKIIGDTNQINNQPGTNTPVFNLGTRNAVSYVIFDSLIVQNGRRCGFYLGENNPTDNIIIKNCLITDIVCFDNSACVYYSSATKRVSILNCLLSPNSGASGVIAFKGANDFSVCGSEIRNCGRGVFYKHGVPNASVGPVIQNCYIHDASDIGIVSTTDKMLIRNNLFQRIGGGTYKVCIGIYVDLGGGCDIAGGFYNQILNNTLIGGGIDLGSGIIGCPDRGARYSIVKRNVIFNDNSNLPFVIWPYMTQDPIPDNIHSDSNIIWTTNTNVASWYNKPFSTLESYISASKLDSHSVFIWPAFTNPDSLDYSIKIGTKGDDFSIGANIAMIDPLNKSPVVLIPPVNDTIEGYKGSSFSYQIKFNRRPAKFTSTKLPAGLTLDTIRGIISGKPINTGIIIDTINAWNASGSSKNLIIIFKISDLTTPQITSPPYVYALLGRPFTYQITAIGNPKTYSAKNLPAGFSINDSSGLISGIFSNYFLGFDSLYATNNAGSSTPFDLKLFILDPRKSQDSVPINGDVDFVDTFVINDTTHQGIDIEVWAAEGGNIPAKIDTSIRFIYSQPKTPLIRICIPKEKINPCNGFFALMIIRDTVSSDTVLLSRPIRRTFSNCDDFTTRSLSWTPVKVSAYPDSSRITFALKTLFSASGGYDKRVFRLVQWDSLKSPITDSLTEFGKISDDQFDLKPGRLFWLKTLNNAQINFGNATTISLNDTFQIILHPNTWTDISSPFNSPIFLNDVFTATQKKTGSELSSLLEFYSWIQSAESYATDPLYLFRMPGATMQGKKITGGDRGFYSVFNPLSTSAILCIPPISSEQSRPFIKQALKIDNPDAWSVRLKCSVSNDSAILPAIYCGGEKNLIKPIYYNAPPSFSTIAVMVSDSLSGKYYGHILTTSDIENGQLFPLVIFNKSSNPELVSIEVDSFFCRPLGISAMLFYWEKQNMLIQNTALKIKVPENGIQKLYLGTGPNSYISSLEKKFAMDPDLRKVFPNPFRTSVCIQYVVPFQNVADIQFSLINILGKCVWKKKECSTKPGLNEFVLNKSDIKFSSGTYFLKYGVTDKNKIGMTFQKRVIYVK